MGADQSVEGRTLTAEAPSPGAVKSFRVVVVSGPDCDHELFVESGKHIVGAAPDCTLTLHDRKVSRHHLELQPVKLGLSVRDLGSKNGSWYDGARFTQVTVGVGAVIRLGDSELRVLSATHRPQLVPSSATQFGRLVGRSLPMREVFAVLEKVAPSDATVLIEGETGTGKELCAEAIHAASRRAEGPLVVCDLAGISRGLIESELFGHKKGAFTGAESERRGLFADAAGGTVFIDEIGELDRELQPRLLRLLERREVRPLGGSYRAVDVRVLAATNRDLEVESRERRFRADLFHRLAVVRVKLPPLRERKEDLPLLVGQALVGRDITVPDETLALLTEYDWPGNVRELFNAIERAVALLGQRRVLEPSLLGIEPGQTESTSTQNFHVAKERLIAEWERRYLVELLRQARGSITRAARASGLQRTYLYQLLRKHDLMRR